MLYRHLKRERAIFAVKMELTTPGNPNLNTMRNVRRAFARSVNGCIAYGVTTDLSDACIFNAATNTSTKCGRHEERIR